MRIAVNTRLLIKDRLEGIGWFSFQCLKRMVASHPEHRFDFIFDRPFNPSFVFGPNVNPVVLNPPTRHPLLWYIWFEHRLPALLRRLRPDVFFSPDGYLSLHSPIPSVPVIHDINFVHRPGDLPPLISRYYNYYFPRFAQKASHILTVSAYSKADISKSFGIDPASITVVGNGVHEAYGPLSGSTIAETRQKLTGGAPYFLFIGSLHPRKNLPGLLKAYDQFRKEGGPAVRLVIVGERMFRNGPPEESLSGMTYRDDVLFPGRLDPEELRFVLGSALALTFFPLFEGFGIPAIEAMQAGIPVLASDCTSLPEVVGDAGLLTDPTDLAAMAGLMHRVATEPGLREDLIQKGFRQVTKFSWDRTAEKVWEVLEGVHGNR